MAYCRYCGKEGRNRFCTRCGRPLDAVFVLEDQIPEKRISEKGFFLRNCLFLLGAALLIGAYVHTIYFQKTPIDMDDFIEVEFSGTNGEGVASFTFDQEAFEARCRELEMHQNLIEKVIAFAQPEIRSDEHLASVLANNLKAELSKDKYLKNGEDVTVLFLYSEELFSNNQYEIIANDNIFRVTGLK